MDEFGDDNGLTKDTVTQLTQSFQKDSPRESGDGTTGRDDDKTTAPTGGAKRLAAGRAAMLELVKRIRRTDGTLPRWRLPFELARVILRVPGGGGPVFWEPVCVEFCNLLGLDPNDAVGDFAGCLVSIGPDRFDAAAKLALAGPLAITPDPGTTYAAEARVCYYLSEMNGGGVFPFPVERLGIGVGKSKMSGSRAFEFLTAVGLILPVGKADHSRGISRTVRFLGTVPWWE